MQRKTKVSDANTSFNAQDSSAKVNVATGIGYGIENAHPIWPRPKHRPCERKCLCRIPHFHADGWQGSFYPPGMQTRSFLSYYAMKFKTVEIDITYYGTPRASTVMNWYERTPPDVKAFMQLNGVDRDTAEHAIRDVDP